VAFFFWMGVGGRGIRCKEPPNCSSLSSMPSKIDTLKLLIADAVSSLLIFFFGTNCLLWHCFD
jgi:hypothetical protein